jgi:hypothetical protein
MSDVSVVRQKMIENGYTPLPNVGKACYLEGWPSVVVDAAALAQWKRRHSRWQDTGIRIENGLCVLDLDINHEVADDIADRLEKEEPDLARALLRFGKGYKRAWFFRVDEPFSRITTRRWLAPDADLDRDGAHAVEAFGGASSRQFGAIGAHTRKPDGSVEIAYEWADGLSPVEVPLADLPEIIKARLFLLVDLVEQLLAEAGFTPVQRSQKGEIAPAKTYDLTDDMTFDCNDGLTRSLAELQQAAGEPGLRCSAAWIEKGASNPERCLIGRTHNGTVTVWESASGITHMPAGSAEAEGAKVRQDRRELLQRLAEKVEQLKTQRATRPNAEDSAAQVAAKLLQSYAWCPTRQMQVVPFWSTSIEAGMTLTNFRTTMLPYAEIEIGPRLGEKKINPADLWVSSPMRVNIAGLQLRPDMPRPLFEIDGVKWVNTYDPEVFDDKLAAQGDAQGGIDFLAQLLPDPDERAWFTQWLAHKYRFPHVPGPAVVMVARQHGTGRGTLAELLKALFGSRYVGTIGFDHFAGRTYQSQYTEWQADNLIVVVNESSTADQGGSVYRSKHDTYERLKEIVDPRAQDRQIVAKGIRAFVARVCASYVICTNNPDALPLPPEDRRFWVGSNGEPREPEFWDRVNAWMAMPANVAAFARWLADLDLAGFDPYAVPPMTEGKQAMMSLASSDTDRAYELAVEQLPGDLILPEQVLGMMRTARDEWGFDFPDRWEAIARRLVQRKLVRVGTKDGPGWVIRVEAKKYPVYARDGRTAGRWRALAPDDEFRREVLRNGAPGAVNIAATIARLRTVIDNTEKKP